MLDICTHCFYTGAGAPKFTRDLPLSPKPRVCLFAPLPQIMLAFALAHARQFSQETRSIWPNCLKLYLHHCTKKALTLHWRPRAKNVKGRGLFHVKQNTIPPTMTAMHQDPLAKAHTNSLFVSRETWWSVSRETFN